MVTGRVLSGEQIRGELSRLLPPECFDRPVWTMSGGMKRRTAICRAVLAQSQALLMDEPFTGLDRDTKAAVLEYLKAHTKGRTLLLVTHDPAERDALAQHVLNMAPAV